MTTAKRLVIDIMYSTRFDMKDLRPHKDASVVRKQNDMPAIAARDTLSRLTGLVATTILVCG